MSERKNQYAANCEACGRPCKPGDGTVSSKRNPETFEVLFVVRHDHCPEVGAEPDGKPSGLPVWAVYCDGLTPAGNKAHGIHLVKVTTKPDGAEVYPACDQARAIEKGEQ